MAKRGILYIVSAPSGAGKTSLIAAVGNTIQKLHVSISHTTRKPRPGEKPNLDYYFISEDEFKEMIAKNAFLEYAQVFGNFYGTSRQFVEETLKKGDDVILEIDWQGARQVRINYVDAISIFILPPSFETLKSRLVTRHQDNVAIIEQRMKEAKQELSHYYEYDYLICNENFETAISQLKTIIEANRLTLKKAKEELANLINELID